jgi:hypothetical protein
MSGATHRPRKQSKDHGSPTTDATGDTGDVARAGLTCEMQPIKPEMALTLRNRRDGAHRRFPLNRDQYRRRSRSRCW